MSEITCTNILNDPHVQSYRLNLLQGRLPLNKHGNPKRPLSSWNIYLQVYLSFRSRFVETYCTPGECASNLKTVIWSRLSREDRKAFEDAAEELRKDHKMAYTGYKYTPVPMAKDTEDGGQTSSDGGPCKSRKHRRGHLVGGPRHISSSPSLLPTLANTPIPAMAVKPEELDTAFTSKEEAIQFAESQEVSEAQAWNWAASILNDSVSDSPSSSEHSPLYAPFPAVLDSPMWLSTFSPPVSPSGPSFSTPSSSPASFDTVTSFFPSSPSPSQYLDTSDYKQGESPLVMNKDDEWLRSPYWDLRLVVG